MIFIRTIILFFILKEVQIFLELLMCTEEKSLSRKQLIILYKLTLGIVIVMIMKWTGLAVILLYNLDLYNQNTQKKRAKSIRFYGYKIFKFIINQISSGIRVSDAILNMYKVVHPSPLRNALIDVAAHYSQTSDLKSALDHLKKKFKGLEVDTLCLAIEQGIQTGSNEDTLHKMENLLFKRYMFQIKSDTKLKRKRGVIAVMFLAAIIVLMIVVPVSIDMFNAFNQIFY
ncbi:MAG: type II secretion system F family protein [Clostridia bacterium]|nr:type II secretion system F family protein [Clostridia bacterium]